MKSKSHRDGWRTAASVACEIQERTKLGVTGDALASLIVQDARRNPSTDRPYVHLNAITGSTVWVSPAQAAQWIASMEKLAAEMELRMLKEDP